MTEAPPAGVVSGAIAPFEQRRWWPWVMGASAAWIALLHATLWWIDRHPVPRTLWGDEATYLTSAMRLLAGDSRWWPEPLWPPLYPQFLAGLIWIGGDSMVFVVLAQGLLLAVTAVLLFDLVFRLTQSRAAGFVAAVVTLGYPPLAAFSHYLWPEIVHLFLFVVLLWILVARVETAWWCALAGVALGLALLSKSLLLPFVPVFLVAAVWGRPWRHAVVAVVLVSALAAATVAPTVIANTRRLGTPSIANSATFNLWVGLNDVGRESFRNDVVWPEFQRWVASADSHAARDRILRSQIRDFVRERGFASVLVDQLSKQPFRLFNAGCYFTDQLPGGAAQTQAGAGYLGLGPRVGGVLTVVVLCSVLGMYVVAAMGLALGGCRGARWVRILLLFIAYNLVLLLFLHVKTRYRIQMLPAALVGAGCLVAWIEAGWRPRPTVTRVMAAVGVSSLLIWFAIG